MKTIAASTLAALLLISVAVPAHAQQLRVRGELVSFDGTVLAVNMPGAGEVRVELAKNGTVASRRPLKLADLKPGAPLGVTAVKGPDGKLLAREINVFPGASPPNPGHHPMDDGATMTNATITATVAATVAASGGGELTLSYPGGSQQVVVPESALIYTSVDGERSLLKPGVAVTMLAVKAADGRLTANRVQVMQP